MGEALIGINLYGACQVRGLAPHSFEITGAKHKALFALLATTPTGCRTRRFLQETLWGVGDYESGRQNLRRAIADIKQAMGPAFGAVLRVSANDMTLDLGAAQIMGRPEDGAFLEGIEVRTPAFLRWLEEMRRRETVRLVEPSEPAPVDVEVLPTVVVIPFRAVGFTDDAQSVYGDWLAEEMSRSLSRSHLITVISHLSARRLALPSIDIQDVRSKLNASYCLIGTIRPQAGDMVLDADLIDCASGRLLWTRQQTVPAGTPFEAGLELADELVLTIGRTLTEEAIGHAGARPPQAVDDHRLVMAGVGLMHRPALRDFARSRDLLEEAARRAPRRAEVHAWLGKWHILSVFNEWSVDAAGDTARALDCTARALDIAPENSFCLTIDGFAQTNLMRRLDLAEQRYSAALRLNPSEALGWLLKGALQAFKDDGADAIQAAARARRLSPIDPFGYFYDTLSASAHLAAGDYEQALAFVDRSIASNDRHLSSLRSRITALHYLGRKEEARAAATLLLQRQPQFTVENYRRTHPAADFEIGRRVAKALTAAGIR
jgi:TolB-like protein